MNDTQLLLSIKLRLPKRLGNDWFHKSLDELIIQSKHRMLEKSIMEYLIIACTTYNIKLTDDDLNCVINHNRNENIDNTSLSRLWKLGFYVTPPKLKKIRAR